jgi:hypothetical protein
MQRVFKGGAVLAFIAILAAPAIYADDSPLGTDPLGVRIKPPGGLMDQDDPSSTEPPSVRIKPPIGVTSAMPAPEPPGVRIAPPTGVTSTALAPEPPSARIGPPGGLMDQDFFELFWLWLQVRIAPPTG